MNIEEGLLTAIVDKLRVELQGMIRYELSRGLDKPEANNWTLLTPGPLPFTNFLNSTLCNTLYPKETLQVSDYLQRTTSLPMKFKFFKETGQFFLPNETFLTNSFMSDLINGQKTLLSLSELNSVEDISEIKPISHFFLSHSAILRYLPANFSKSHHDSEYVTTVLMTLDPKAAYVVLEQQKMLNELQQFKIPKLECRFSFKAPQQVDTQPLWDSVGSIFAALEEVKEKVEGFKDVMRAESENKKIVSELVSKNYNEDTFDQLLEMSNS